MSSGSCTRQQSAFVVMCSHEPNVDGCIGYLFAGDVTINNLQWDIFLEKWGVRGRWEDTPFGKYSH